MPGLNVKRWIGLLTCCAVVATSFAGMARADEDLANRPMPPDFHRDRFGCYVPNVPAPVVTAPPISAAQALAPRVRPTAIVSSSGGFVRKSFSGQDELSYRLLRANYFREQHDPDKEIAEYRLAAATPRADGEQPSYHDLVTRVPLSVTLYRAARLAEARDEWRRVLADRIADAKNYHTALPRQPPAIELIARGRLDLVAGREVVGWWPGYFDSGAGQHMVRGLEAAKQRRYTAAAAEWRIAAQCSARFELPHLMLGYVSALNGDLEAAKNEWVATLEGVEPGPGDMQGITAAQFDAMEALLHYTGTSH